MPQYRIISTTMARPSIDIEAESAAAAFARAAREGALVGDPSAAGQHALSVRRLGGSQDYWIATSRNPAAAGANDRQDRVFALLWEQAPRA